MSENQTIGEAALHAFVDNELDVEAHMQVEDWLQKHPEQLQNIAVWKQQKEDLKAAFDPVLEEPLPIEIQQTLNKSIAAPKTPSRITWRSMAASILILALGAAGGWFGAQKFGPAGPVVANNNPPPGKTVKKWPTFAQNAISAHLVFGTDDIHPVEYMAPGKDYMIAWVKQRMHREIIPPALDSVGFKYFGGRMLTHEDKPAVLYMYENIDGKRITVLIGLNKEKKVAPERIWTKSGVHCAFWFNGDLGVAVTSNISKDELKAIGSKVREHFREA